MKPKINYEDIGQEVLPEVEIDKDENNEVPMFIRLPESAPIEPIRAGTVCTILPWCC